MQALIVSGGHLDDSFAAAYFLSHSFDVAIAADSGMEFFARHGWAPDYIVGDFDSVEPKVLQGYFSAGKPASQEGQEEEGQKKPVILQFQPEKDETDTEIAIRMAIEKGCGTIHLLGATGTRIDHVLGNIHLLGMAMERGAECLMVDPYNLPVTPEVSGLTLRGLKYPLENAVLRCYHSLGVSNEITGEQAEVSFQEGVLLVVESKDD